MLPWNEQGCLRNTETLKVAKWIPNGLYSLLGSFRHVLLGDSKQDIVHDLFMMFTQLSIA